MADVKAEEISGVGGLLQRMKAYQDALAQEQTARAHQEEEQAKAAQEVATTFGALVEAATLVAMADGQFSDAESKRLTDRVVPLTGGRLDATQVGALAQEAAQRIQGEGASARTGAVASTLSDDELRRAALLVAGAVGWTEGGIGQKEGLALQALARAFGISIEDMHKLLAEAHAG
ncbi:TerB family tellurite resistance protein [Chondromyces apiculatus]|uniref:Co-chaperone DjlA N-terminal domain-containing protein n=1 Tax=Chondromyces apiculatus DSM 436 TaxID=1192034 RepID=A0A017SX88_9BACT|nr:TerB family tellurite resistance protein [Chondromyces apiculatus]EYF01574.1 Hypothetical protein CAP_8014 [Chondromyces apiculatus DSM 436]